VHKPTENRATHKAVFLDRDGIINVDHGYVYRPQDMEFVPGIFELCTYFRQLGYQLVVVTNQSGIGRGYYSEADFHQLTDWMKQEFAHRNVPLDGVYFCPHHPESAEGDYLKDCDCRKPQPGMLLQAASDLKLDLSQCLMVGDKLSDMQAAQAAGVQGGFWLHGQAEKGLGAGFVVVDSLTEIPARLQVC